MPRGGIIVSVAETSSFGYQPLVAAGGTAIVSVAELLSQCQLETVVLVIELDYKQIFLSKLVVVLVLSQSESKCF